jgi:hypothetical protein
MRMQKKRKRRRKILRRRLKRRWLRSLRNIKQILSLKRKKKIPAKARVTLK